MKLEKLLIGMVVSVGFFAISTYVMTGSLWTTFTQSLICFLLIQVGYFSVVVFRIVREKWSSTDGGKDPPVDPTSSVRDPD